MNMQITEKTTVEEMLKLQKFSRDLYGESFIENEFEGFTLKMIRANRYVGWTLTPDNSQDLVVEVVPFVNGKQINRYEYDMIMDDGGMMSFQSKIKKFSGIRRISVTRNTYIERKLYTDITGFSYEFDAIKEQCLSMV